MIFLFFSLFFSFFFFFLYNSVHSLWSEPLIAYYSCSRKRVINWAEPKLFSAHCNWSLGGNILLADADNTTTEKWLKNKKSPETEKASSFSTWLNLFLLLLFSCPPPPNPPPNPQPLGDGIWGGRWEVGVSKSTPLRDFVYQTMASNTFQYFEENVFKTSRTRRCQNPSTSTNAGTVQTLLHPDITIVVDWA